MQSNPIITPAFLVQAVFPTTLSFGVRQGLAIASSGIEYVSHSRLNFRAILLCTQITDANSLRHHCIFFLETVSLCSSPGCPGTHSVDQVDLKFKDSIAYAF